MQTSDAPSGGDTPLPPHFQQLPRNEAKACVARLVAEMPASRDRLAGMLALAGADPELARSTRPEALDPIWTCAVDHWPMRWQSAYIPPPAIGAPAVHKGSLEALGPLHLLPSWFVHDRIHALRFHQDTLWVIDVLARHLGGTLVASRPSLYWVAGPARPAKNIDRGCPVVGNDVTWVNPFRTVQGLVGRSITGADPLGAPTTPRALYERWIGYDWG